MKWEYSYLILQGYQVIGELNKQGQEGWECCGAVNKETEWQIILKRPIPDTTESSEV